MQSVMDSLCRCFGSTPLSHDAQHDLDSIQHLQLSASEQLKALSSAARKRATNPPVQDSQWDGNSLQQSRQTSPRSKNSTSGRSNYERSLGASKSEQKQQRKSRTHKRKRSGSRDDIFRTKKLPDKSLPATPANPLSQFLSNHPVIAHSLCFATPVKDSADTDYNKPPNDDHQDGESTVVSDTNSHNNSTAEDTMTSTVYYETTKLAGLCQRTPPMPLFTTSCLHERDEIQTILEALREEQELGGGRFGVKRREKMVATISTRPRKETIAVLTRHEPPAPPAVYCSSSNSSEGSKAVMGRRTTKQARQV